MIFSIFYASRTRLSLSALSAPLAIGAGLLNFCGVARAQTLSAPYASNYSVGFNGSISGVTSPTGGLLFERNDPNTLLLMGSSANSAGTLYSVPVIRGAGNHITGFGAAVLFATAPNNDGGLVYAPNGDLLFAILSSNQVGEIKPSSASPDKIASLPGATASVGALQYVPAGFSNAGQLKIVSYSSGRWFDALLTPDGSGTIRSESIQPILFYPATLS